MKSRHTASLVLVGWYLMVPPEKCVDKTRNDLGLCDMHFDSEAPLSEWLKGHDFGTAEKCNEFLKQLRQQPTDLGHERKEATMRCISSVELRRARKAAK